MKKPARV